jgi:hypothetical protein
VVTSPGAVDRGSIIVSFEFIDSQDVTCLIDMKDAKPSGGFSW